MLLLFPLEVTDLIFPFLFLRCVDIFIVFFIALKFVEFVEKFDWSLNQLLVSTCDWHLLWFVPVLSDFALQGDDFLCYEKLSPIVLLFMRTVFGWAAKTTWCSFVEYTCELLIHPGVLRLHRILQFGLVDGIQIETTGPQHLLRLKRVHSCGSICIWWSIAKS